MIKSVPWGTEIDIGRNPKAAAPSKLLNRFLILQIRGLKPVVLDRWRKGNVED
ncbi:hypothetical protein PDIG_28470 [Penicillium digitatum PHI26]|uniref:Uncharacterized protein n=2 Tax=Penicillium digitatum TaxID=36651 RepID=K9GPT0_PEND2|nr:hypothetical protein PDIP_62910 [Penicillium digitatum Pd1]EKV09797.1 hypothetical protein PDIP_62910 [Penicillium digitatum Pd1]EKV15166.1 hypothetical protein PDIG_28470 [Penicillium digitatum PHI26]